jgi:hypothetical protein
MVVSCLYDGRAGPILGRKFNQILPMRARVPSIRRIHRMSARFRLLPIRAVGRSTCVRLKRIFLMLLLASAAAHGAEVPAYFAAALAHFSSEVPPGWAYHVAVLRGAENAVEGFDPSRPPGGQWTLLQRNGREPTADETNRYLGYRTTNNAGAAARATFARGDLDFSSAEIIREDSLHATIRCRFRSDAVEPLLAHLIVVLVVRKSPAIVESALLHLIAPYSPVIGMKMDGLDVETKFSPPTGDHPGLPLTVTSHFHGRLLWFWSISEDSRAAYADFRRVVPADGRAAPE